MKHSAWLTEKSQEEKEVKSLYLQSGTISHSIERRERVWVVVLSTFWLVRPAPLCRWRSCKDSGAGMLLLSSVCLSWPASWWKGRAQRPGQPLPQGCFSPSDKSLWPWNEHNSMQVRLVPCANDFSLTGDHQYLFTPLLWHCGGAYGHLGVK